MVDLSIGVDIVSIGRMENIPKLLKMGLDLNTAYLPHQKLSIVQNRGRNASHLFCWTVCSQGSSTKKQFCRKEKIKIHRFKKIEIQSRQDGAPIVRLPKPYQSTYHCECSISHDGDNAIAFALMQKK